LPKFSRGALLGNSLRTADRCYQLKNRLRSNPEELIANSCQPSAISYWAES